MPYGKLDVYVEGAVGIKDTALFGKGSPYCTVTVGTQAFSTSEVPDGGTHPYFNTTFQFKIDRSTNELQITLLSKNKITDDDYLGYCRILFKDVFYHGHVVPVTQYNVVRPSGKPGGQIRLSLTFYPERRPEGFKEQPRVRRDRPQALVAVANPQRRPSGPYTPQPPTPRRHSTGQPQYYAPSSSSVPQVPPGRYPPLSNGQRPFYNENTDPGSESSGSDSDDSMPQPSNPAYNQAYNQNQVRPRAPPVSRPPGGYYQARSCLPQARGVVNPAQTRVAVSTPQTRAAVNPQPAAAVAGAAAGAFLKNVGVGILGAAVGSVFGDGNSVWGSDDVSVDDSYGYVEAEQYECADSAYYEEGAEVDETYDDSTSYDSYQADAAAGPYQTASYSQGSPAPVPAPAPAPGRGYGPARGRASMRGGRGGRGPMAQGAPPRGW